MLRIIPYFNDYVTLRFYLAIMPELKFWSSISIICIFFPFILLPPWFFIVCLS